MIAKGIITILLSDQALGAIVGNRIAPIIDVPEIDPGTKLSAIYYSISMYPEMVKNGGVAVNHTITLLTVTSSYLDSWNLSLALRNALEMKRGTFSDIQFNFGRCLSIEDEYEFTPGNMYGQKLTYKIRTAYY